jgi:hypothetical protein
MRPRPFGVMAEFSTEEGFLGGIDRMRKAGFRNLETFTPYAVEAQEELLPRRPSRVGWFMLGAGALGGLGAFFLQWYAARDYPLNVGGRPLNSWPAFIPITFELTILSAALAGVLGLLWVAGLPRLHHPAFSGSGFERASQDRFFVCVLSSDPQYSVTAAKTAFEAARAESVEELFE